MLPSGTVLGTKVQKDHKAFFLGEHHYTESKLSLLSVITQEDTFVVRGKVTPKSALK